VIGFIGAWFVVILFVGNIRGGRFWLVWWCFDGLCLVGWFVYLFNFLEVEVDYECCCVCEVCVGCLGRVDL